MSDDNSEDSINLKVLKDGYTIKFKLKKEAPLRKLMYAYCERQGLDMDSVVFLLDGVRLNETQTPSSKNLKDGDVIEVFQKQEGGKL